MNTLQAIYRFFFREPETAVIVHIPGPAPAPAPVIDPRMLQIKKIVMLHLNRKPFDTELLAGLSERTRLWLSLLNNEMLLKVAVASPEHLRDHMKGKHAIRGVLASDMESLLAYQEACRPQKIYVDSDGRRSGGGPKRSMGGMKMGR